MRNDIFFVDWPTGRPWPVQYDVKIAGFYSNPDEINSCHFVYSYLWNDENPMKLTCLSATVSIPNQPTFSQQTNEE